MATVHPSGRPLATGRVGDRPATSCVYNDCEASPSEAIDVPLCGKHAARVYRAVHQAMEPAREAARKRPHMASPMHAERTQGHVYFLRQGDRIKIGFSTQVQKRRATLGGGQLLATIPGTMRTEHTLHVMFDHLRNEGEWFWPGRDLMAYIEDVNSK